MFDATNHLYGTHLYAVNWGGSMYSTTFYDLEVNLDLLSLDEVPDKIARARALCAERNPTWREAGPGHISVRYGKPFAILPYAIESGDE